MKIEASPVSETTRRNADALGSCVQRKFASASIWTDAMLAALQNRVKGGKTRWIEYVRLLLATEHPKVTSYHAGASTNRGTQKGRSSQTCLKLSAITIRIRAPTPGNACGFRCGSGKRLRGLAVGRFCSFAMKPSATMQTNTSG